MASGRKSSVCLALPRSIDRAKALRVKASRRLQIEKINQSPSAVDMTLTAINAVSALYPFMDRSRSQRFGHNPNQGRLS